MYIQHIANITYSCFLPDLTRFISSLLPYGLTARIIIQNFFLKSKQITLEKEIIGNDKIKVANETIPSFFAVRCWEYSIHSFLFLKAHPSGVDFEEACGLFYSSGNVAPVRASSSLSPLKLQSRSTSTSGLLLLIHI